MTIQNRIFLMLLVLSLLMGAGILIPGYLKIRGIELQAAMEYTEDRSFRMKQEVKRVIDVLQKAGVSDIDSYVEASKAGIIEKYTNMQADPRVNRTILDSSGKVLFTEKRVVSIPITPQLIQQMQQADDNEISYESGTEKWLVSFQMGDQWGWYLLVSMPNQEVYRNSLAYLYYVLSISAPVLLFVLGLYVVISRQLRRKITLIMDHIALYKDGQYEKRIPSSVPDEISVLQVGINSMIDSIEMEILSRKSIEEELHASKLQAEQANQEKTTIFEHLSKEIVDPMSSIIGYAKLLTKTKLSKKQDAYTSSMLNLAQNLKILVNDTLNFSKLSAEVDKSDYALFDLAQVMSTAFDSSARAGQQKGIKMSLNISKAIPSMVFGDKARCIQIISNLIHNAVKFTSEGGVDLCIELEQDTDSQHIIKLTLLDSGIGISPSDRQKMLEPFAQFSTPSQADSKGLGLGLAIVKGFLNTMDGSIDIESELGEGTKITVLIPFDKNLDEHHTGIRSFDAIKDITVLAVDHNEFYRQFIKEVFADVGIKCIVVKTGKAVISCLEEEDIDLILMDMRLPEKSSEVTINTIRKEMPTYLRDIPIIAATSNVYEKDIERYSALNVSAHIAKPFEAPTLFKTIEHVLQEQSAEDL